MIGERSGNFGRNFRKFVMPIGILLALGIAKESKAQQMDFAQFSKKFATEESFRNTVLYAITGGHSVDLSDSTSVKTAIDSSMSMTKSVVNPTPQTQEAVRRNLFVQRFLQKRLTNFRKPTTVTKAKTPGVNVESLPDSTFLKREKDTIFLTKWVFKTIYQIP